MQITLIDIGKRFNRQWIFKGIDTTFENSKSYALVGNNGSGKSTLLQLIYNYQTISKGQIKYVFEQQVLEENDLIHKIAFAAPYLELIEEFTMNEMLRFHFDFLPKQSGISLHEMIMDAGLTGNEHKQIRYFSSGMKQRLKLILALFSYTPLLLLDEPCSNLDEQGIAWYRKIIQEQLGKRTIIIASNQLFEYDFCESVINISYFKPLPNPL